MNRSLRLVRHDLVELTTDELAYAVAGTGDPTELCNPCTFTWCCDDIKTLQGLQTRLCTA